MNPFNIGIIDTYTHLHDASFRNDRSNVLVESRATGIIGIVTVSKNLKDAELNLKLAKVHPELLPAAGLYPGIVDLQQAEKIEDFIVKHAKKLIAIGEVGLDFMVVKEEDQREIQRNIFSRFIDLADELGLPLNVHSRFAGRQAIALLLQKDAQHVQLHAFDDKADYAMKAVEAGYYFSISPSVIRSEQKQKLVKKLPLTAILLETDSPILGPELDERNVPSNIKIAAETIAQIKGISLEEVFQTTLENTYNLYGKTIAFGGLRYDIKDFLNRSSS